jgi:glycosyltransferase involved in cell wall biosynthesis
VAAGPYRIAFVCPRYALTAAGGAEVHAQLLAERLRSRGHRVEVLTTCAEDHFTWKNTTQPGVKTVNGVPVRRFLVNPERVSREFLAVQQRISRGHRITRSEEELWIGGSVVSDGLNEFLLQNCERYDAVVFIPYLFGLTYFGVPLCPEQAFLIPCLHDEPFAYLSIFREMFARPRGLLFNTIPEMELAQRIYGIPKEKSFLVSLGFEAADVYDPDSFRSKRGLKEPYVLFAGRREGGKNIPLLVDYFRTFHRRNGGGVRLVLLGTGEVNLERSDRGRILDFGYLSLQEKLDAMAGCRVFCQPSVNESLSIVMMEAWLAGSPVLVHGQCAVTRDHVERSDGGLWFDDYFTFEECLKWFLAHPKEAASMGGAGGAYVRRHYSWEAVLRRFEESIRKALREP